MRQISARHLDDGLVSHRARSGTRPGTSAVVSRVLRNRIFSGNARKEKKHRGFHRALKYHNKSVLLREARHAAGFMKTFYLLFLALLLCVILLCGAMSPWQRPVDHLHIDLNSVSLRKEYIENGWGKRLRWVITWFSGKYKVWSSGRPVRTGVTRCIIKTRNSESCWPCRDNSDWSRFRYSRLSAMRSTCFRPTVCAVSREPDRYDFFCTSNREVRGFMEG